MVRAHIDLFSGIGGFALAARWAGLQTVQFVEIDPFCQKVLRKNFKGVPIHDDIKTFTYTERERNGRGVGNRDEEEGKIQDGTTRPQESGFNQTRNIHPESRPSLITDSEVAAYTDRDGLQESGAKQQTDRMRQYVQSEQPRPFLLTGGFPCQPFSCAGKRRGKEDDRALWPEMLRVISEARPTWVIGENVAGFINMGLDGCISDLERENFEVQAFIIPACAKNTPHRRDRVWIVAHSQCGRISGQGGIFRQRETPSRDRQGPSNSPMQSDFHAPNTNIEGLQGHREDGECAGERSIGTGTWQEPWLEVATRLCVVDDGLPGGLARPKGWRVKALKGAGNAIVPAIAFEIIQAIVEIDNGRPHQR